jgi:HAD superfamily hydrolase (TIGR01458 family)
MSLSGPLAGVNALLVDLEGTVYEAGSVVPGAAEALEELARRGIACGFVTNTTSRPRSALVRELSGLGIEVEPERLYTAPLAGRDYLISRGLRRCHLLVHEPVLEDFAGIEGVDSSPQAVVVGDIGEDFTFERLNRAFRFLVDGAAFVTLARNRYHRGLDGLLLDQGPFVAALEYAAGREATLVGKPSPAFYAAALRHMGIAASQAAVVGDDLESDVGGGQAAGLRGILVRTGKFREEDLARSSIRPDAVIGSLAEIADLV